MVVAMKGMDASIRTESRYIVQVLYKNSRTHREIKKAETNRGGY